MFSPFLFHPLPKTRPGCTKDRDFCNVVHWKITIFVHRSIDVHPERTKLSLSRTSSIYFRSYNRLRRIVAQKLTTIHDHPQTSIRRESKTSEKYLVKSSCRNQRTLRRVRRCSFEKKQSRLSSFERRVTRTRRFHSVDPPLIFD